MLRCLLILMLFVSHSFSICFCYVSYISNSGSQNAYNDLDNFLNDKNNDIKDYWDNDIKNVIDNIKEETKKRNENLTVLENLEKERLLVSKEIEFILKQGNDLLDVSANIEAERE